VNPFAGRNPRKERDAGKSKRMIRNNSRSDAYNARERNRRWNDPHERTRKKVFGAALSPMPISLSRTRTRWRFLPRGRTRVNAISAYCLSPVIRSCKKAVLVLESAPLYEIAVESRLYCYHDCTYTYRAGDYSLFLPPLLDKIEMYCPYKSAATL